MTADNPNSLSKPEAIAKLKQTIAQLESVVTQLDETSVIDLPSSNSIQTLMTTATELETVIAQKSALKNDLETESKEVDSLEEAAETSEENTTIEPEETLATEVREKPITPSDTTTTEEKTIPSTSEEKAETKSNKKWLIGGIVAAVIAIAIPLSWYFISGNEMPQLIAQDTSDEIIATDTIPNLEEPKVTEEASEIATKEPIVTPEEPIIEEEISQDIPSEISAESRPKKVAIETIKPQIQLTSEQTLIVALDKKVGYLDKYYEEELVISIEPDFDEDIVTVTLTDDWYQMQSNRQDKILAEMLKRSQQLEFAKLKITDPQQNLIARSPVVGKEMVVLRRTS